MTMQHSPRGGRSTAPRSVVPSRKRRNARRPRPAGLGARFEALESRHLLAANILAEANGTLTTAGGERVIEMEITLPNDPATATAILMIETSPAQGSTFDPAAAIVRPVGGTAITPSSAVDDGDGRTSRTTLALTEGTYELVITGDGGAATTGGFDVRVSLLGDTGSEDASVDNLEHAQASAALVQAMGGGNFVTMAFFESLGISLHDDQYDPGFDVNGNGVMDTTDLQAIAQNANLGTVQVELEDDAEAPVISNISLVNDTGVSNLDRITTDATIQATINDDSEITELLAGVDAAPTFDLLTLLGGTVSGDFTITPAQLQQIRGSALQNGTHTLRLLATDVHGNAMAEPAEFTFTFLPNNTPPQVTEIPDVQTNEDAPFTENVFDHFTNNDTGDALTFTATRSGGGVLPSWLSFNATTAVFTGTPTNANVGNLDITVTATDTQGATASSTFRLTVNNVNDAPTVTSIPNQTAMEQTAFSLNASTFFSDPDAGDTLTFQAVRTGNDPALPAWLSFNANTGQFSGTPQDDDVGSFDVRVTATDEDGLSVSDTFTITVTGVNDDPVLVSPIADQTATEDQQFTLDISGNFDDPDGDELEFTATLMNGNPLPAWLTLNSETGVFSGTPANGNVGTLTIVVTASDESNASATDTFTLTIENVNDPPVVNNQTFAIDTELANGTVIGTVVASDPDVGDTLTYSLTGGTGANRFTISPTTGQLTIVDASNLTQGESFQLNVQVADAGNPALTDTAVITVEVADNVPPVAVDDSGFSTDDRDTLEIDAEDLLENDTDAEDDDFSIVSVSATSARGATVNLSGTTITYDPTEADELISLHEGDSLVDTFMYTIEDDLGRTSSATVSVTVDGTDDVRFRLVATDTEGNVITEIETGQEFELLVTVEDVRPNPTTVFSAYLDIDYPSNLITVDGDIEHINPYTGGTGAGSNITTTPGIIDEAGAVSFNFALTGENDVLRIPFVAGATPGTVTFSGNVTEDQVQHPVLLVGLNEAVDPRMVDFGETTLEIVGISGAAGISVAVPQQNPVNALDVNDDGSVSPLDAVLVLNALTDTTAAGSHYVDVTGDGHLSPMDALWVINGLGSSAPQAASSSTPQAAMSASATVGGVAQADLTAGFAQLHAIDTTFERLATRARTGDTVKEAVRRDTGLLPLVGEQDEEGHRRRQTSVDTEVSALDALLADFGRLGA